MDDVSVAEYNPQWPALFDSEEARLRETAGEALIVRIEHFGSTAVPGLAAKPIIDLLVGVRSLPEAREILVPRIEALGYSYWRDNPHSERMFFVKGLPPNGPRTHHIHMVEPDSELWERLLFRDYLRLHSDEADRYARLKRELAERFPTDREAYTEGKTEYILSVTRKARETARSS